MDVQEQAFISVPRTSTRGVVCLLRDEVGDEHSGMSAAEVTSLLGRELAPLSVWRSCALEFYRHGYKDEFCEILKEIVKQIEDEPDVANSYRMRKDQLDTFENEMIEIYNSLAAYSNEQLGKVLEASTIGSASNQKQDELKQETIDNLRSAEDLGGFAGNDFMTVIRGFYALQTGEFFVQACRTQPPAICSQPPPPHHHHHHHRH